MDASMSVGVLGDGPAAEAIDAALADVDITADRIDREDLPDIDVVAAVGGAGERVHQAVNQSATGPWIAIEGGGIGGQEVEGVDAAVSVLDPRQGCFACLATRVRATQEDDVSADAGANPPAMRLSGAHAGRLLIDIVRGIDRVGIVIELPYAERELLPVPGCSCDTKRDATIDLSVEDVSVEDAADRAERAVDDRLGLITAIGEAESFPAPYYLAHLADVSGFSDAAPGRQAAGVSVGWDRAFMKAAGEALERYCAGVYRTDSFRTAPTDALDAAIGPSAFVVPESGFEAPAADEPIPWVDGVALATGEAVSLPAEFVHFPPPRKRHRPAITTGLGLGSSGGAAVLSGLYEVIERDATMLAWYSTFEPLGLSVETEAFQTLAKRARSEGLSVQAVLVTQDIDVPVVTAAVHRSDAWPQFAVGSSANLEASSAATGALAEALQNWMELRGMGPDDATEESTAIGRYADFPPDARSLVDVESTVPIDSVGDPVSSRSEELDRLLDCLADADLSTYAARVTTRDVDAIGFEAVRVLVPDAQPLFTGDRYFGERARTVPRELGFRPRLDRPPHPYP